MRFGLLLACLALLAAATVMTAVPAPASHGDGGAPLPATLIAVDAPGDPDRDLGAAEGALPRAGDVLRTFTDGVRIGLLVAVMAVGLVLIQRTSGVIDLAHGQFVAVGALLAFFLNTGALGVQLHLVPATAVAVVAAAALGAGLERGILRPLRGRGTGAARTHLVLIAVALLIYAVGTGAYFWVVGEIRPYHQYATQSPVQIGALHVTPRDLALIALSLLVLAAVTYLLRRTRFGRSVRAVADAPALAAASGVDVQRVIVAVWALAAGLAALAGVGVGISEGVGAPMGFDLLLLILAGAILGGLGTVPATVAGSLAVGLITEMSTLWVSEELRLVWVLALLVIALARWPDALPAADPLRGGRRPGEQTRHPAVS
jgi:neutral amino acid transport system permease protein